ncbi:MAG: TMEM165/GDT1 family protein [Halobacteriaceae archaeon]
MVGAAFAGPPLAAGLDAVVRQYAHLGPLLAAFLANLLATFGDKGQLAVITLATRYDAKRVFAGAMAAFAGWSALEVLVGQAVTRALPGWVMRYATGALFVLFGLWTTYQLAARLRATTGVATDGQGVDPGLLLPDWLTSLSANSGAFLTAFVFVGFAEFGDKTQLLTINLAATFPGSLLSVYVGVVAALGLRTGIDAFVGERAEQVLPTRYIEGASAVVFVAFGLFEFGLLDELSLILAVAAAVAFCAGAAVERQYGVGA